MTKKGVNKLPERWLPYSNIGKKIDGTRFIAFKVPLKELLCKKVAPAERFSPLMLMEMEPNLSLVIDLTNTTRYYDKEIFLNRGVDYAKIYCPGKIVPPSDVAQTFFDIVEKFMSLSKPEDAVIGVHCTHGVNRTGYLICRYMIDKLGYEPKDAIEKFQECRGHKIERDSYIQELLEKREAPKSTPTAKTNQSSKVYEKAYGKKVSKQPTHQHHCDVRTSAKTNDIPDAGRGLYRNITNPAEVQNQKIGNPAAKHVKDYQKHKQLYATRNNFMPTYVPKSKPSRFLSASSPQILCGRQPAVTGHYRTNVGESSRIYVEQSVGTNPEIRSEKPRNWIDVYNLLVNSTLRNEAVPIGPTGTCTGYTRPSCMVDEPCDYQRSSQRRNMMSRTDTDVRIMRRQPVYGPTRPDGQPSYQGSRYHRVGQSGPGWGDYVVNLPQMPTDNLWKKPDLIGRRRNEGNWPKADNKRVQTEKMPEPSKRNRVV